MSVRSSTSRRSFLLLAVGVAGVTGCRESGGSMDRRPEVGADVIRIGEYVPLTGGEANYGESVQRGALLAIEEANQSGGALGRPLVIVSEDNQSKAGESATIVKRLIHREHVVAVLGEVTSGRSLEAAPICQAARIPMISPTATSPKVTEVGDCIFRTCFIDPFQGRILAEFALRTLRARRAAILSDVASPYSVGLADFFRSHFASDGGQVVADQRFSTRDKDFRAQLTAIKAAGPDVLVVPAYYTEAGLVVVQARQLGLAIPLLGGDGWEAPELIQIAGSALENAYYSTNFSAEVAEERVRSFVRAYQARFDGVTPDSTAAAGYDNAWILIDAIRRAGVAEPARIRDALAATRDFAGVTGLTTLDAQRNASKSAVIMTVKEGRFRYVETVRP